MEDGPIGIFDSGVGGLTVLKEIMIAFPKEDIVYLGDTLNFPYGSKSKEEIIKYSINNVKFLLSKNVKLIVIACGTATSYALDELRKIFSVPIIGIIEPTVDYVEKLNLKQIGVIATVGTIKSNSWGRALISRIPNIEVINKACPMMATVAEEGKAKSEEGRKIIKEYMEVFKERKIKDIILRLYSLPNIWWDNKRRTSVMK